MAAAPDENPILLVVVNLIVKGLRPDTAIIDLDPVVIAPDAVALGGIPGARTQDDAGTSRADPSIFINLIVTHDVMVGSRPCTGIDMHPPARVVVDLRSFHQIVTARDVQPMIEVRRAVIMHLTVDDLVERCKQRDTR